MMNATEREELLKVVEEINSNTNEFKIVYVDKTCWANVITKRKQTIEDLLFLGFENSATRIKCINSLKYDGKYFRIHKFLSHVNLDSDIQIGEWKFDNGCELRINYQEFCNPVTGYHLCNIEGVDKILKGQMMGQNSDSAFQTVYNVVNEGYDYAIKDDSGRWLKNNSSIIELLSKCNANRGNSISFNLVKRYSLPQRK